MDNGGCSVSSASVFSTRSHLDIIKSELHAATVNGV